jgi:hypothetical protein
MARLSKKTKRTESYLKWKTQQENKTDWKLLKMETERKEKICRNKNENEKL